MQKANSMVLKYSLVQFKIRYVYWISGREKHDRIERRSDTRKSIKIELTENHSNYI